MQKKFKNEYSRNRIDYNCNKLFGPSYKHDVFFLTKNEKGMSCIEGLDTIDSWKRRHDEETIKHSNFGPYYFDVDSYVLLEDIIDYGNRLYAILKNNLMVLKPYVNTDFYKTEKIKLVEDNIIEKLIDHIFPLCKELCEKYELPFISKKYLQKGSYQHNSCPISYIVNQILLLFSFQTIFTKLSDGYKEYMPLYKSFKIKEEDDNLSTLKKLIYYLNIYSSPNYHLVDFSLEICMEEDKPIPITVTSNLFSFAFEIIQNNIAALSFYSEGSNDNKLYVGFKKCARCLKNISDELETSQNTIPIIKNIYCNSCKKEMRKISSSKYEHKISAMYKELKRNAANCPDELSKEIENLMPREKITLKDLEPIYKRYQEIKKDD